MKQNQQSLQKAKISQILMNQYIKEKAELENALTQIKNNINTKFEEKLTNKNILTIYFQSLSSINEYRYMGLTLNREEEDLKVFIQSLPLYTFFPQKIWDFTFTKQFQQKLLALKVDELIKVVVIIKVLVQGKFNKQNYQWLNVEKIQVGSIKFPFQYDYQLEFLVDNKTTMFFQIFPKKYPLMDNQEHPIQFDYVHELIFVELNEGKYCKNPQPYEKYLKTQQSKPNFFADMKFIQEFNDKKKVKYLKIGEVNENQFLLIGPRIFKPLLCLGNQFVYNNKLNLWMTMEDEQKYFRKLQQIAEIRQNNEIIRKYCYLPSSQQLLTIIRNIPNFRVKLTQEQQNVISYGGDALVISNQQLLIMQNLYILEQFYQLD